MWVLSSVESSCLLVCRKQSDRGADKEKQGGGQMKKHSEGITLPWSQQGSVISGSSALQLLRPVAMKKVGFVA